MTHYMPQVIILLCVGMIAIVNHRLSAASRKRHAKHADVPSKVHNPCEGGETGHGLEQLPDSDSKSTADAPVPTPTTSEASVPTPTADSKFVSGQEVGYDILPLLLEGAEKNRPWRAELEQLAGEAEPGSTITAPDQHWANVAQIWAGQHCPQKKLRFETIEPAQ